MAGFAMYRKSAHNRLILTSAIVLLLTFRIDQTLASTYSGGTGEPNNPYRIATAQDLNDIGNHIEDFNKHFVMVNDIDLGGYTGTQFNIIGDYSDPFTGVFDGNDHTISNFTYTTTGTDYIGLFGCVDEGAEIENVTLLAPDVDAGTGCQVGALAGAAYDADITNCYVVGGSVTGDDRVGGLIGSLSFTTVYSCSASCNVTGDDWGTGGLIGNCSGWVKACCATGSVTGDEEGTGGLIGYQFAGGTYCSYATGSVTAPRVVGGLVGKASGGLIQRTYAAGLVTGGSITGGLVGWMVSHGSVTKSFWDEDSTGQSTSDGGGVPKSTAQMQDPATFMAVGWDFAYESDGPSDVWAEPPGGGYPILWWQLSPLPPLHEFPAGTGELNNPYLISTADDLNSIGYNPRLMDSHFAMTNDIDLAGAPVFSIGNLPFSYRAIFDGNSFELAGATWTADDPAQTGLFGYVGGDNAQVKDLGLAAPVINAPSCLQAGALVCVLAGTLSNCYVDSANISAGSHVGALVGRTGRYSVITDCHATGTVQANEYAGGLLASNSGTITNCYAQVAVSCDGPGPGGFVGGNVSYGVIRNCYATGSVTCLADYAGGFAGVNNATIENCSAIGDIQATIIVGGFVGMSSFGASITACYAKGAATGTAVVGGLAGYIHEGQLSDCYATGPVTALDITGGLVGYNSESVVAHCYAAGTVAADSNVGGITGFDDDYWDPATTSPVSGIPTAIPMPTASATEPNQTSSANPPPTCKHAPPSPMPAGISRVRQ